MQLQLDRLSKHYGSKIAVDRFKHHNGQRGVWLAEGQWCRKNNPDAFNLQYTDAHVRGYFV